MERTERDRLLQDVETFCRTLRPIEERCSEWQGTLDSTTGSTAPSRPFPLPGRRRRR
jgi:hypothetical protein